MNHSAARRLCYSADRVGFEPTKRLPVYTLSRRVPSAARPPIQTTRPTDAQTRSKYQDAAGFATGPGATKPPPLPRVYLESPGATNWRGATDEHAAEETRAGRSARGQRHPHLAGAGEPVPRPDEGFPQGRQGAGARARAEAAPCPEAPEARDREAHRQTRAASKVTRASNGQQRGLTVRRFTSTGPYLPPNRTPAVIGMKDVFAASNDFATST